MQDTEKVLTKRVIECEVWSRVVGYFRPVKDWNLGMKEQFRERRAMIGHDCIQTKEKG